jgi:DNA-directed RNA polymerase
MDQRRNEEEMAQLGKDRASRRILAAREKGLETTTTGGRALLEQSVGRMAEALKAWLEDAKARSFKGAASMAYVELLPMELVCALTCRCVLDGVSLRRKFTRVVMSVANVLEDEVRFKLLKDADPNLMQTMFHKTKPYGKATRRKWIFRAMKDVPSAYDPWGQGDKARMGVVLVEVMAEATGLIQIINRKNILGKTTAMVEPTPQALEYLERSNARSSVLSPIYMPCVEEPKPWTSPVHGGFHSDALYRRAMVKTTSRDLVHEMTKRGREAMPLVYDSINALQSTGYTVNPEVLAVLQELWARSEPVAGMPARNDEALPNKPEDIETNEEARLHWRRKAALVHDKNANTRGSRIMLAQTLHVAQKYEGRTIWFAHQLDWRGRMYPVSYFLHPQGPDICKGLLSFAKEDHLTQPEDLFWLKVQGANAFGFDKAPYADRAVWADAHRKEIEEVAEDPLSNRWWMEADAPWQFLAFSFEMKKIWAGKQTTNLPCYQDASQSGIQIISMLMRDRRGGKGTNVVPSPQPADLYGAVARVSTMILEEEAKEGHKLAKQWLEIGIDRTTCKRPVMTRVYNATQWSATRYVRDWAEEKGIPMPRDFHTMSACGHLGDTIRSALDIVLPGMQSFMGWCKDVAQECAKKEELVRWVTPNGFIVEQHYAKRGHRDIKTFLGDRYRKVRLKTHTDKMDKARMVNGLAPNLIHSLDAALAQRAIAWAAEAGVSQIAAVHDSFGVTAPNRRLMAESLRFAAVSLFHDTNYLEEFINGVAQQTKLDLPAPPARGNLDINEVMQSEYFFS